MTATYPPSTNGVAVAVSNIYEEFRKRGHKVYVFAPKNKTKRNENIIEYPSIPNPIVKDYPIPLLPISRQIIEVVLKEKFDVVHAHHPYHIASFAEFISMINNAPFVFTYHSRYADLGEYYIRYLPKDISRKIASFSPLRICTRADLVISPSNAIRDQILRSVEKANVEVIPTGIPKISKPRIPKEELRHSLGLPANKVILLVLSRLAREKNIEFIIKSMKYLDDRFVLVIGGTGPDENNLRVLAHRLGLGERIIFKGKIDHEKVSEYYSLADVFLFSSKTETQGLTLLEASYFGVPIVAVDSPVTREFVPPQASFLTKSNPQEFSSGILRLMNANLEKISHKAQMWVKRYQISSTAQRLLTNYEILNKERKRKKPKSELRQKLNDLQGIFSKGVDIKIDARI